MSISVEKISVLFCLSMQLSTR